VSVHLFLLFIPSILFIHSILLVFSSLYPLINPSVYLSSPPPPPSATTMHLENLEMKTLREDMEKKMRDQLNKMDISYQKEAFAALSEAHKLSMFQNAKLKDEVALQVLELVFPHPGLHICIKPPICIHTY
jgi:hypothetical protein